MEINFAKSRFTATLEITIHVEKISHLTFHGEKKGRSQVTKLPFTTLNNTYTPLFKKKKKKKNLW